MMYCTSSHSVTHSHNVLMQVEHGMVLKNILLGFVTVVLVVKSAYIMKPCFVLAELVSDAVVCDSRCYTLVIGIPV